MGRRYWSGTLVGGLGLAVALTGCGGSSSADNASGTGPTDTPSTATATPTSATPTPTPTPTTIVDPTPTTPTATAPVAQTPAAIAAALSKARGRPCKLVKVTYPQGQVAGAAGTWGCLESTESIAIFAEGAAGVKHYLATTQGSSLPTVSGVNWVVVDQYLAADTARKLARALGGTVRR